MDRLIETFQLRLSTLGESHAIDPPRKVDDLPTREHLAGPCDRAQACSDVQGAAPVAALDGHGFASVESDSYREREGWIGDGLLDEPML